MRADLISFEYVDCTNSSLCHYSAAINKQVHFPIACYTILMLKGVDREGLKTTMTTAKPLSDYLSLYIYISRIREDR